MDACMRVHVHIEPFYATAPTLAREAPSFGSVFFIISFPSLGFHGATDGGTASTFHLRVAEKNHIANSFTLIFSSVLNNVL